MKTLNQFLHESSDQLIDFKQYPLEAKFKHFNQMYFNGDIPDIPVKFGKAPKGTGGVTRAKTVIPAGTRVFKLATLKQEEATVKDLNIIISNEIPARREIRWDLILLHEMIHAWLMDQKYIWDNHGPLFIKLAHHISQKLGHTIPLTDKMDAEESSQIVGKPAVVVIYVNSREVVYALATPNWKDKANELKELLYHREHSFDQVTAFYVPSCVKATSYKLNRNYPFDRYRLQSKDAVDSMMGECKAGTLLFTLDFAAMKKNIFGT